MITNLNAALSNIQHACCRQKQNEQTTGSMLCCGLACDGTPLYMRCVAGCWLAIPGCSVSQSDSCFDETASAEWRHCCDASTESLPLPQSSGVDQRRSDSREVECKGDTDDCRFTGLDDDTTLITATSSELLVTLAAANGSIVTAHCCIS